MAARLFNDFAQRSLSGSLLENVAAEMAYVQAAAGLASSVVLVGATGGGLQLQAFRISPASAGAAAGGVSFKGGYPLVMCGRGDKRTAKGKRFRGSFGNSRPKDSTKSRGLAVTPMPPRPKKKDELEDGEYIHIDIDEILLAN